MRQLRSSLTHWASRPGVRAEQSADEARPIASLGATVHVIDGLYDDAQAAAIAKQTETGALAVHPFEHPTWWPVKER